MKVSYRQGIANQSGLESCAALRKWRREALTEEDVGRGIEPRNGHFRSADVLMDTEGNMSNGVSRESLLNFARSETSSTHQSSMRGTWEILPASNGEQPLERSENAYGEKSERGAGRKSDGGIVLEKHSNKAQAAESVEGRPSTKRNIKPTAAGRTQSRETASIGLLGVREAARKDKETRFTALMHHLTLEQLRSSFYALKRRAAPGLDGVTWQTYAESLEERLVSVGTQ